MAAWVTGPTRLLSRLWGEVVVEQISDTWIVAIQQWAKNESLVEQAYVFGSRAKGIARPESDLDIAIKLSGETEEKRTENWMF